MEGPIAGASKDAFAEVKEDVELAGSQALPEVREVKPIHWTPEDVRQWLGRLQKGALRDYADTMPIDINGRALVRMNKAALAQVCLPLPCVAFGTGAYRLTWFSNLLQVCAGGDSDAGLLIFNALRNEIDRVDKVLLKQRRGVVEMNARLKNGW